LPKNGKKNGIVPSRGWGEIVQRCKVRRGVRGESVLGGDKGGRTRGRIGRGGKIKDGEGKGKRGLMGQRGKRSGQWEREKIMHE